VLCKSLMLDQCKCIHNIVFWWAWQTSKTQSVATLPLWQPLINCLEWRAHESSSGFAPCHVCFFLDYAKEFDCTTNSLPNGKPQRGRGSGQRPTLLKIEWGTKIIQDQFVPQRLRGKWWREVWQYHRVPLDGTRDKEKGSCLVKAEEMFDLNLFPKSPYASTELLALSHHAEVQRNHHLTHSVAARSVFKDQRSTLQIFVAARTPARTRTD